MKRSLGAAILEVSAGDCGPDDVIAWESTMVARDRLEACRAEIDARLRHGKEPRRTLDEEEPTCQRIAPTT